MRSPEAQEFQIVRPGLAFWQVYDPSVKTDLSCCAIESSVGWVFVDPVPLAPEALEELTDGRPAASILLTNANHERGAGPLAKRLGVEIWAPAGAQGQADAGHWFGEGELPFGGLRAIGLDGFAPGESAFAAEGILIFGDALIHAPPYGFAILPDKYCADPKAGRESLRKLLQFPAEILTFAHGLPIVSRGRERLAALVS